MPAISQKVKNAALVRRAEILGIISASGAARVGYLSRLLQVSAATIRGDLQKLEKSQQVVRVRGAVLDPRAEQRNGGLTRTDQNEFGGFAHKAASLVTEGEAIIIGGGAMGKLIIEHLRRFRSLTIITNEPALAIFAARYENFSVIVPGGIRTTASGPLVGSLAADCIKHFSADKYFLYSKCIDPERGALGADNEPAQLSLQFVSIAAQVIVIAGSDAFVSGAKYLCCPPESISTIITDRRLPEESRGKLGACGITVVDSGSKERKLLKII